MNGFCFNCNEECDLRDEVCQHCGVQFHEPSKGTISIEDLKREQERLEKDKDSGTK